MPRPSKRQAHLNDQLARYTLWLQEAGDAVTAEALQELLDLPEQERESFLQGLRRIPEGEIPAYLGIAESTYRRYTRKRTGGIKGDVDPLPKPGADGCTSSAALDAWKRGRPGSGPPKGSKLTPTKACDGCGTLVKRRTPTKAKGEDGRQLLCRACIVLGWEARQEGERS